MKFSILLLALSAAAFSSCTSAYKTGQTPDDVYFSPGREGKAQEYVQLEKKDDRYYRGSDDYYEDRYLRMRMQNRYRWSVLDDYYFYNTYAYNPYGYYNSWNSPWNSYYTWNNYYNPYYGGVHCYPGSVIIKNPVNFTPPSRAVAFNPNSYNTGSNANRTGVSGRTLNNSYNNTNNTRYNNSNSNRSSLGESVRKVFSNSNSNGNNYNSNNSNSNNSTPTRSYTPSSSSSSSSSSGSSNSGGGGSSRPPR